MLPFVIILLVVLVIGAALLSFVRRRARDQFAASVLQFITQTDEPARRTRMSGYDVDVVHVADDDARVIWHPLHPEEFDEQLAVRFAQYKDGHRLAQLPESVANEAVRDELGAKLLPEMAKLLRAVNHGTVIQIDVAGGRTTLMLYGATPDELAACIIDTMRPGRALHRLVAFEGRRLMRRDTGVSTPISAAAATETLTPSSTEQQG